MTASKPAYLFVGGVSHTPVFFESMIKEMAALGYQSEAIALPTCSADISTVPHLLKHDEVAAIKRVVTSYLDDKELDVVLVMHSYGGIPGSRSVKGLDKEARIKAGYGTGIVEIVFIAAFLIPDNAMLPSNSALPSWLTVEKGCRRPNETAVPLLFSDMTPEEGARWLGQFHWHRIDSVTTILPGAPWRLAVPKTYVLMMGDETATLEFQLKGLQEVIDSTWTVKSMKAGHEPFLSQPANLAKVLVHPGA